MSDKLDDFFAKKDAAKKSGKKSGDKVKEKSKKSEKDPTAAITIKPLDNDDGEWKEIEEKKDNYEGLRIQSMTIKDKEEEMREKQKEQDAVEQEKRYEESGGPWKGLTSEPETSEENKEVDPELLVQPESIVNANVETKARYLPPSMRNKPAGSDSATPTPINRRGRAPEIENTREFPTLGQ